MWFERDYIDDVAELQEIVDRFLIEKKEDFETKAIPVNVYENAHQIFVAMPLAGVEKEKIDISYQNGKLTVRAKKEISAKDVTRVLRQERTGGDLLRVIDLSVPVQPDSVQAKYQSGYLLIELLKKEEAKTRKITIE